MIISRPFLSRFATRLHDDPEARDSSAHPPPAVESNPLKIRAETRFTRVKNETTDDD
jgi:hypothetical protein